MNQTLNWESLRENLAQMVAERRRSDVIEVVVDSVHALRTKWWVLNVDWFCRLPRKRRRKWHRQMNAHYRRQRELTGKG